MAYPWAMAKALKSFLFAAALVLMAYPAAAEERPLTVVELYTSQGCSSCPPADAFLGELAGREGVLALSFHVDYWDYIGWKDPYASRAHSERQRRYARHFGKRYVYTPQMVIHGIAEELGSDRSKVLRRIDEAAKLERVPVRIDHGADRGTITISVPQKATNDDVDIVMVWLVVYDRNHETAVKRGENRGRTIRNFNVVRGLRKVAAWRGEALEAEASLSDFAAGGGDACAVLLQSRRSGRIVGAARLALDQSH
ncbi:MAG: DUF1223 domain-containing protein [Rhodospirillales bacterium]|jgi:hypothetical protein|nr:DUF1223 domain-containing protein [Rhodospirillales bacterium]MDP6773842.1 DUF1223 domain-containing protein [Rhodospirillales bacterium]